MMKAVLLGFAVVVFFVPMAKAQGAREMPEASGVEGGHIEAEVDTAVAGFEDSDLAAGAVDVTVGGGQRRGGDAGDVEQ